MVERGVGEYQINKAEKSQMNIRDTLADGEWARYTQIVDQTGLSTATVSKFLKKLENEGEIEKRVDLESGEYPYPAYYRLTDKGLKSISKETLKKRIDETPLEFSSLEITRQDLKEVVEFPTWYKLIDKVAAKIKGKEISEDEYKVPPTPYTAFADSEVVKNWRPKLYREIKTILRRRHPNLGEKRVDYFSSLITTNFFLNLEESTGLNILSSLKLPPMRVSKWKPTFARTEKDLYAELWLQLFNTLVFLIKKKYDQYDDLEKFLEDTQGTSIVVVIDMNTDLYRVLEYTDKTIFELEQLMQHRKN